MTRICFFDTETTGLHPERRIWDVALIVRDEGYPDVEHTWLVSDVDLSRADQKALSIGHFYDRHPSYGGDPALPGVGPVELLSEQATAARIEHLTRHATIIGAVPQFDTRTSEALLSEHGMLFAGHYHLHDIETLVIGWLYAHGRNDLLAEGPPWSSHTLSEAIGVPVPDDGLRHTALGDARWVRAQWDHVTTTAAARHTTAA